jgi:predicted small lipoprotein YifL
LILILSVAGCGYKGPLYLPQDKPAAAKPAPAPAPAADPSTRP